MRATRILETCLYVDDLERAKDFYVRVLGLTVHSEMEGRHVFFRVGDAMFLLFNPEATKNSTIPGIGDHGAFGPGHAAFATTDAELDGWRTQLAKEGVAIESEGPWPQGGYSIYFRDPAGNSVELATPQLWGIESQ